MPTIIAYVRRRPDLASIALFNVFLGWTIIGWVIAIVWCFRKRSPLRKRSRLMKNPR